MDESGQRAALLAHAERLEREIASAHESIESLQRFGLSGGALSRRRGPGTRPRLRHERRIAQPVSDAALVRFVAAVQHRLSVVGWARADSTGLVWRSAAARDECEVRVARDPDGATLSIQLDDAVLVRGVRVLLGVIVSTAVGAVASAASGEWTWALAIGVAGLLLCAIGQRVDARRCARIHASLETVSARLVADLEAAAARNPAVHSVEPADTGSEEDDALERPREEKRRGISR